MGDVEGARDTKLVRLALDFAGRSGKQVLVGLGEVNFMNTALLFELLKPTRRGSGRLPWLCGPLEHIPERVASHPRVFELGAGGAAGGAGVQVPHDFAGVRVPEDRTNVVVPARISAIVMVLPTAAFAPDSSHAAPGSSPEPFQSDEEHKWRHTSDAV
ncbi:hypothetical protein AB0K64_33875 [Streptomyces sp. NPDC053741]|uniref:hypothetical protein n=1 Tax=unclassified Streptomyces TaxID=2593676 RepID=UPI0023F7ACF6|nr:hypothetical protein [Streptomyces sp. JH010]MDF6066837.1 hypothetical protein [Streptomyces sp. JH010]